MSLAPMRRISWGVLDQGVSSITNFALAALIDREVSPAEFGAFTTGFLAYTIVMGVSRSVSMEPLLMRFSNAPRRTWERGAGEATGTALTIGMVAGSLAVLAGLLSDGPFREVFLALSVSLPGLILQDSWRFAFFAAGRGRSALLNDLVWALALLVSFAAITMARAADLGPLTLAWGAAASLAAAVGSMQARLLPVPTAARRWIRENRQLASRILGEFIAMSATAHLTLVGIGLVAGVTALGAIRGAQILLGPFNVMLIGVGIVAIPEGTRILRQSSSAGLRAASVVLSSSLAICALALGGLLKLVPSGLGRGILGATWPNADDVIVPVAVCFAFLSAITGALLGLRVLGSFRHSLSARLGSSAVSLSGAVLGAGMGGARGGAWGWAVGLGIGSVIWWRAFNAAIKIGPTEGATDGLSTEEPPARMIPPSLSGD